MRNKEIQITKEYPSLSSKDIYKAMLNCFDAYSKKDQSHPWYKAGSLAFDIKNFPSEFTKGAVNSRCLGVDTVCDFHVHSENMITYHAYSSDGKVDLKASVKTFDTDGGVRIEYNLSLIRVPKLKSIVLQQTTKFMAPLIMGVLADIARKSQKSEEPEQLVPEAS